MKSVALLARDLKEKKSVGLRETEGGNSCVKFE